ncbi:MAG: hypothetical protein J4A00_09065 [Gammaproteobacteria bacterium]|nr:hypothetical protein [Gammaproteobacteria bacterium]
MPAAIIISAPEAMELPHMKARRSVRVINDRAMGPLTVPGMPLRFSECPELPVQAPFPGEHNHEILQPLLDISPDRLRELETAGILHNQRTWRIRISPGSLWSRSKRRSNSL